jgi:hypothetical protein
LQKARLTSQVPLVCVKSKFKKSRVDYLGEIITLEALEKSLPVEVNDIPQHAVRFGKTIRHN